MELNIEFIKKTFIAVLAGVPVTLKIAFISLLIAVPVAFFMSLKRMENKGIGSKIIKGYVSLIRGTPMVLQILFLYSLLPSILNYFIKEVLGLEFNIFTVDSILYAYIVFSINTAAVLSEVFRSALSAVNQGQMEAALSTGLSKGQAYVRIIIPQALVVALPNICNATINLLKNTSLAFMMTVQDITAIAKLNAAYGYNYIEAYLVIFFVYIALCTIVQVLFRVTEKALSAYKGLEASY